MKQVPIDKLIDWADRKSSMYIRWYPGIAEQGYDDKEMLCGNWWVRKNGDLKMHPMVDYIEKAYDNEIEISWDDEWTSCSDCGKAVRVVPDCYEWEKSFIWASDCDLVCHECCEDGDVEDLIEYHVNDTSRVVPSWFYKYLEAAGFICYSPDEYCQRFETGLYPGQNDMPEDVAKDIEENLPGYDYLFKIDSVGQFDIHWSVFLRKKT